MPFLLTRPSTRRPGFIIALLLMANTACRENSRAELGPGLSPQQAEVERVRLLRREEAEIVSGLRNAGAAMATACAANLYGVLSPFRSGATNKVREDATIAGLTITSRTRLNSRERKAFVAELVRRSNYLPAGDEWTCLFEPAFVIEFETDSGAITAAICLKCGEVEVRRPNQAPAMFELNSDGSRKLAVLLRRFRS